jgi:hypothetical protein
VAVAVLDEAVLQIITPMLRDTTLLNGLVKEIAPDRIKEIFKIMQKPELLLKRMSELDKSLLVRKLIERIIVQYDTLEIKWTELALDMLPVKYQKKTTDGVMTIATPALSN